MSLTWKAATKWPDEADDPEAKEEFEQYLHVSPHRFEPGTRLTPGVERGVVSYPNARNHKVFLAPNEDVADMWVQTHGYNAKPPPEEMHVYEVEPGGSVTHFHGDYGAEAMADHAVVKRHLYSIPADDPDHGWR